MTHGFMGARTRLAWVTVAALVWLMAAAGTASAVTATFTNSALIGIPDDSPALPYPSTINVSGFTGNVQKVTATLRGFTHTCPDDVAVLLVGPSGARSTLMGNVGGCPGSQVGPLSLTFDQTAASQLNDTDIAVSGIYRPSESGPTSLSPPAPVSPYPVSLDTFDGTPANGVWQLFIEDQSSSDFGGVHSGWSLKVTSPVNTLTISGPKLNKKKGTAQLQVTVRDSGQVILTGKGVRSSSASVSVTSRRTASTFLTVKTKGKAARKLNSTGAVTVKTNVSFTPNGGAPNIQTKKIKLKKTLRK